MKFKDKYTTKKKKDEDTTGKEAAKYEISDDAFAIGDALQMLIYQLERLRLIV